MQNISLIFPPSYIFESMRSILIDGIINFDSIVQIILMNFFLLIIINIIFLKMINISRKKAF